MNSKISTEKISAYENTHYRVGNGTEAFFLKIGQPSHPLKLLYSRTDESCGVFITAFNPLGGKQSLETNEAAHASLVDYLQSMGIDYIEGAGVDPTGTWPEEKSLFALGIDEGAARQLGNDFAQDAVVWVAVDAIPQLILLR